MPKLRSSFLAAALTCSLATPTVALASPFGHGFRHMAQETAPAVAPDTAPVPPPSSEVQPVAPQPYGAPPPQGYGPAPYAQPQPGYYGPQPAAEMPAPRSRRKGLMIAGWTMFGASYLFTALTGAIMADLCASTSPCKRVGYYMLIPAVGPFIAMGPADSATGTIFLGLTGLVQTAGLVMGIVGTAQFAADGRRQQQVLNADGFRLSKNLRFNAGPAGRFGGAMLDLRYRF